VKGKGGKERIAPLNKAAIVKLLEYLKEREDFQESSQESFRGNSFWLFPGNSPSKHLTRQGFHKMLKGLARKAEIDPERVHPHVIRHSFATHLLNSGVDLRVLQELLGHSDISTTEIYTHLDSTYLRNTLEKFHPRYR
jgi:integrase/recombinase XerD